MPARDVIRLRPVNADDTPFLCLVYASTREEELSRVPWTDEQKAAFILHQFHAQKTHYEDAYSNADFQVIEVEGQPAGRLYIYRQDDLIHVIDIALLPAFRHQGIGTMLFRELQDEGRSTNKAVEIYVENFNPAHQWYERMGFEHVDTNGLYHLMKWRPA